MGVHSSEEITEFGQSDLKVLSDMLADKPFFFGDEPTNVSTIYFIIVIKSLKIKIIKSVNKLTKKVILSMYYKLNVFFYLNVM